MRTPAGDGPLPVEHVYVHYPFCLRKCPYCDFNSHAGREAEIEAYLDALLLEARALLPGTGVRTLYVGGGTPTHVESGRLERYVAGLVDAAGGVTDDLTVEANPGTIDTRRATALARAGVQRVSVGAQSFHAGHLETLGRIHGPWETVRAVDHLRHAGIEHLSVDLILAIPGQSLAEQARDLAHAVALEPEHISAYVLTIEEGTAFARRVREGRLPAPDDEREAPFLHLASAQLQHAGFERYEISNYARPGAESKHNLAYWLDADWIGLGAGAHSHVGSQRWVNHPDPAAYVAAVRDAGSAVADSETCAPDVRAFDAWMMGLRLLAGVDLDRVAERAGSDLRVTHPETLARHVAQGLLVVDGPRVRATSRGLDVLAYLLREYVPTDESTSTST